MQKCRKNLKEKRGNSRRSGGMAELVGGVLKGLQGCVGRELGY